MLSFSERLYGLASPAGTDARFPQPILPAASALSCIDAGSYNLWCSQIYAAASGRRMPDQVAAMSFGNLALSASVLQSISPHVPKKAALDLAPWFGYYAQYFNVATIPRISALLGNAFAETGYLSILVENLNYTSASSIHATFPSHFASVQDAQPYVKQPKDLGDKIYGGSMGNAAAPSDDGYNYRGRGILQVTGKTSYTNFAHAANIAAVAQPELLEQAQYAVMSGFWYWSVNGLAPYADRFAFEELADVINYGRVKYHRVKAVKGEKPGAHKAPLRLVAPVNWTVRDQGQKMAARTIAASMLTVAGF